MKHVYEAIRYLLLFLMLGALSYQSSVIHEQRILIQQMVKNPACMKPISPAVTEN